MTASVKTYLHETISQLSEEQCRQVLAFAQALQQVNATPLKSLATDPTFTLPTVKATFQAIDPLQGEGIPASTLLLEDRR